MSVGIVMISKGGRRVVAKAEVQTHVLVDPLKLPVKFRGVLIRLDLVVARIPQKQSRASRARGPVVDLLDVLPVHASAVLPDRFQLAHVEHFAELLELVFVLSLLAGVCAVAFLLLFCEHALQAFEICAVFCQAADVDLRTDEVAYPAA